ncbi:condensin complex protein MksE [Pedobacter alpinus]|uniref:DUF4194 domain-containing protein n=1 Tax=Pedobacter alpinus TaxID=1590643 RepID=A0ABW5TNS0_9SPHI
MEAPKYTADIFDLLSKGKFICSNSNEEHIRKLYATIDTEQNHDFLYDYFLNINFILEKGDEYYYFSRRETTVDLERKIEQAFKWIDILDFLKTFDNAFGSGYRFTPSDILVKLGLDAELKSKIDGIKRYSGGKEKPNEILEKILNDLVKDKFLDIEDPNFNQYKVLASFKYLEKIVMTINISEDIKNEIPE